MNRILRYVNYAIALLLVVVLAAVWWYAYRPLPKISGDLTAPVAAPVVVERDELGVPHIRANSLEDALVTQGYVTAQERFWQMEGMRRLSGGTLAEVIGPAGLESDRESRRLRLRRMAEAAYLALPNNDRAALAAYTRGVNAYLRGHMDRLPVEFSLIGFQPRPWSAIDSLLVGIHMFRTLTTTWKDEIAKRNMLAAGDRAKVEYLFPVRSGGDFQPGSNAWVLAGSRTATGRPILSNDMHLEFSLPGVWFMAHLQAPGLNVSGVTLPGMPGVIVGHNENIAWGITNLHYDVQDLYIEKMDERTGRYAFHGQVEQARQEREIIQVKGGKNEELAYWITRHGPVTFSEGDRRMALRWAAADPGAIQIPILDIDRARNWQEFQTAIARFTGPGSNFVYADTSGNIGYHAAGMLPIRRNYAGDVPVDGSTGEFEWDGYIPFDQLPSAFNPPQGLIVTANQNPFPANYTYKVNGNFAPYYRAAQIRDRLLKRKGWKPEDLLSVQADLYSGFSKMLADQIVAAYRKRNAHNADIEPAVSLLAQWNGQMEASLSAPLIAALAYQHLRTAVGERAAPGAGRGYEYNMAGPVIERLLRERPEGWFLDYDQELLRALVDAIEEGRRMQGQDVTKWRYGQYLQIVIANPVVHRVPWIGPKFDIGPVQMSGSSSTPKQTTFRMGPSMRMNADVGDWDRSLLNIPFGQSGHPLSSHYRDQWTHYYYAQSYPMAFRNVQAKDTLTLRPDGR